MNYDKLFKIVVIGESGVGKTNLMLRYTKRQFDEKTKSTIGVAFGYRDISIDDQTLRLQIWDTAGQERFRAMPQAYYRGALGAVLVFDLSQRDTFLDIQDKAWYDNLDRFADPSLITILVGNKVDLERQVTSDEALEFAVGKGMRYFETSAKDDIGVDCLFEELAAAILQRDLHPKPRAVEHVEVNVRLEIEPEHEKHCC